MVELFRLFLYLVAIIDWYISCRLFNNIDTSFCIEALEQALKLISSTQIKAAILTAQGSHKNALPMAYGATRMEEVAGSITFLSNDAGEV
ncbi:hypothetical protein KW548_10020 [Vibrio neptunius]|nr:hypothetical protein KW548_10020 [Vibrio neptunius]